MKKYFKHIVFAIALLVPVLSFAQAKKPTIMVIPADVWCSEN